MEETGTVAEVKDGQAKLVFQREHSCHKCGACNLGGAGDMEIWLANTLGAKPGDRVVVDFPEARLLGIAFFVYIVPLAAFLAGYALGMRLWPPVSHGETGAVVTGIISFGLVFWFISLYDRKFGKSKANQPKMVRVSKE